jgi:hyaluronoglucosaminidase
MDGEGIERGGHAAERTLLTAMRSFAVRGVVEGFYGAPWSHADRIAVISFLAERGMNAYAYAPKDDAKHRAEWRTPYADDERAQFGALATHAAAHGVRFGFAISPGLDIDYDADTDRAALLAKLTPLRDAGVGWFLLLVDDIPMQPGLGARHAELGSWLAGALDGCDLTLCPTEYVGTRPSPYLGDLSTGLPAAVDVMWTGPTVCSPTITADDARGWTKALGDRRVIVWDNYPVNDALMTNSLHLGPYQGREPQLADLVGGVLCNPMTQARASQIALATAMEFLRAPDDYDPEAAWARAIEAVGRDRAAAIGVLARACADSPVAEPATLDLARRVDALEDELDGPGWLAAVADLRAELEAAKALPETVAGGELGDEVAPWARAARVEAEAGLAALRLLQASRPVAAPISQNLGRAAGPAAEPAMQTAFAVLYLWQGARADEKVVFGPRFALYTPVVQLADGAPALDTGLALREDANAIDALCRLALRTYDDWRTEDSDQPVRVFVDGNERALNADGTFAADGDVILVRQGSACTRVDGRTTLPFTDRRLA